MLKERREPPETQVLSLPSHGSPSSLRQSATSPSHTYYGTPLGIFSVLATRTRPSFRLAQAIFEPNLFPYNTPTIQSRLIFLLTPPMKMEQSVPKRRHIKFWRRGITQKARIQLSGHGKSLKSLMHWIQRYNKHDLLFYFNIYIQNIYISSSYILKDIRLLQPWTRKDKRAAQISVFISVNVSKEK